jgi:hypothetical protein
VDLKRNRIALSMKSKPDVAGTNRPRSSPNDRGPRPMGGSSQRPAAPNNDWFSQAMNNAKRK